MDLIGMVKTWATRGQQSATAAASTVFKAGREVGRNMAELVTGVNTKPVWPPEEDQERIAEYKLNHDLYEGEHQEVYSETAKEACLRFPVDSKQPYLMTNMCGRLTDLLVSRTFGEPYTVAAPQGEWAAGELLRHVTTENVLHDTIARVATEHSWRGASCLKVTYRGGDVQRLEVTDVDPANVYLEHDTLNFRRIVAVNIDQVVTQGKNVYLWRERHELRDGGSWVLNKLFTLETDDAGKYHCDFATDEVALQVVPELADKAPELPTGIADLLVVYIDGHSDYTDALKSLQGEYNNRLTQRMKVLNKHVDPMRYGPSLPASAVGPDGKVNLDAIRYIEVGEGEKPNVGVVTWDGQLGPSEQELKDLKVDFALSAGVDATALFPEQGQAVSSGKALRLQQMTTQGTVLMRHPRWRSALQRVYSICTQLVTAKDGSQPLWPLSWQPEPGDGQEGNRELVALQPQDIVIGFGDGLPPDREADVAEELDRLASNAQTLEAALEKLDGLSADEAAAKADAIREAAAAGQPAAPQVNVTSPFSEARAAIQPLSGV